MTTQQTEALRLAEILECGYSLAWLYERGGYEVSAELRRQHALIAELESRLEAIGAGGVSGPLIGQPQAMPDLSQLTERGAKAWAGVDAQGLRDGGASPSANAGEPSGHIKEPYTLAEIKAKIASNDYSAEMLLQHAMLLLDSVQEDAARYRWLRDQAHPDSEDSGIAVSESDFNDWGNKFTRYYSGEELDAAIDAARAADSVQ